MNPPGNKTPIPFDAPALLAKNLHAPRSLTGAVIDFPALRYGVGLIENWGLIRHARNYSRYIAPGQPPRSATADESAASRRFYGTDASAQRIYLTRRVDHGSPLEFLADADEFAAVGGAIRVDYYDGEELHVTTAVSQPCWVTFVDNWDPNWRARIDGTAVPIALVLGSYKAVKVPAGESRLVFEYRPPLLPEMRRP
jgi:hypothetical protein